jgi:cbb3-type cytochrome oxidase cytochrome c subunit
MGGTGGRLDGITGRQSRDWFEMHLRNPAAVRPGSMMPAFSLQPEQTKALWEYLRFLDGATGSEPQGPVIPFEKSGGK